MLQDGGQVDETMLQDGGQVDETSADAGSEPGRRMADNTNSTTIEAALMNINRGPRKRIDVTSILKRPIPTSPAAMPEAIGSFQSQQTDDQTPIIPDKESEAEGPSPPTTNIQATDEPRHEVVITGVPADVAVDNITSETGASRAKTTT